MGEEHVTKEGLLYTSQGRRKYSRPKRSWMEGVAREMQKLGLVQDLVQDGQGELEIGIGRRRRTL